VYCHRAKHYLRLRTIAVVNRFLQATALRRQPSSFGNQATSELALGFASQPHDWFAFVENDDATGS
jgi:hypothetical protein